MLYPTELRGRHDGLYLLLEEYQRKFGKLFLTDINHLINNYVGGDLDGFNPHHYPPRFMGRKDLSIVSFRKARSRVVRLSLPRLHQSLLVFALYAPDPLFPVSVRYLSHLPRCY